MENIGFNTTERKVAIVGLSNIDDPRLELQFIPKIQDSYQASWDETRTIGTLLYLDYKGYSRDIKLEFEFTAQLENFRDVIDKTKWLQSLTVQEEGQEEPSKVMLICGEIFKKTEYVVTSVEANYDPYESETLLPKYCKLSISVKANPKTKRYAKHIR